MKTYILFLIAVITLSCNQNKVSQIENFDKISNLWFKADSIIINPRNQSGEKITKEASDFSLIVDDSLYTLIVLGYNPYDEKFVEISNWTKSAVRKGFLEIQIKTTSDLKKHEENNISTWFMYLDILSAKPYRDSTSFLLNSFVELQRVGKEENTLWEGRINIKKDIYSELFSNYFHL